jgi:hypothetical protein
MLKFLLAVHLVLAVFAVGPLVHAATTAVRGVRSGDSAATAAASRMLRIYASVSVLVVIAGFGLMSQKWRGRKLAEFGDTWIWLSVLLWLAAVVLVFAVLVPTLDRATRDLAAGATVAPLTGRVAATGGIVAVIFLAVIVLMVYKPGR